MTTGTPPSTTGIQHTNIWALFLIICATAGPLLFILGIAIGYGFRNPSIDFSTDTLSSWVTAIATVAITVLTFILARETWYLRNAQMQQLLALEVDSIKPEINIILEPSKAGINFININVLNLGKGIARNVKFEFKGRSSDSIDHHSSVVIEELNKLAMLRLGIDCIGINQKISSFAFSFFQIAPKINQEIFKPFIRIKVFFEDTRGKVYSNEFAFDFAQYEGMSKLGEDPLEQIANHLNKIQDSLGRIAPNRHGRLDVNVFDEADRIRETTKSYAHRSKLFKQQEDLLP